MAPEALDTWRLVSLAPWPRWALALLAAGAVLGLFLSLRALRGEPRPGRRALLLALRALSALAVLFLLLEPALRFAQAARVKNRFAVLLDASRSMAFAVSPGGPSRAEEAARLVREHRAELERLSGRATLEWHTFARGLDPSDPEALAREVRPTGGQTDLLGALEAVAAGGGRKLAGVLVVSDGADHAALADGLAPAARERLRALGVPVNAVAVGRDAPKDLAVERVAADDFAFVRNTITVEVTLGARGFGREEVPVVLRREGSVVARATVRLQPGQGRYTVPLSFAPDTTGTFVFTVAVPLFPGEAVAENNARSFVLRVIRDRMRVLLVAGRPSWDERFLRGLLKHDPNVDLVSFYILRTNTDEPGPQDELSLIPFPVADIFGDQLRTFDAVIFLDFAYAPYRALDIERFLPALRDYVKGGGAFAMLGGEQSFGEGRYGGTPLSEVLPVAVEDGAGLVTEPFRPRLTEEGRRHPVTRLAEEEAANAALWEHLPPLPLLNRTRGLGASEGAAVLVEAPTVRVAGRAAPVVAVRQVGSGRTLAVATDSSWFWGFVAAEGGGTDRAYQRFWNGALRWLVRDPSLTPVQVEPDRPTVEPGEPVGLSVAARDSSYGLAAGAAVVAELFAADGRQIARATGTSGADGVAHLQLDPPPPGAYKVVASAAPACPRPPCAPQAKADAESQQATSAVTVRASAPEDLDALPRPELLEAVAEATGGAFSPGERLPALRLLDPEVVEVGRRRDVPLWDRGWFLLLLAASLGAEWVLRRRWGHA